MKSCPRCAEKLGVDGYCAGCGYGRKHASTVVPISADVEEANAAADAKALEDARSYCAEHGLTTREQMREFIKKKLKDGGLAKRLQTLPALREPGEDSAEDIGDEEAAA